MGLDLHQFGRVVRVTFLRGCTLVLNLKGLILVSALHLLFSCLSMTFQLTKAFFLQARAIFTPVLRLHLVEGGSQIFLQRHFSGPHSLVSRRNPQFDWLRRLALRVERLVTEPFKSFELLFTQILLPQPKVSVLASDFDRGFFLRGAQGLVVEQVLARKIFLFVDQSLPLQTLQNQKVTGCFVVVFVGVQKTDHFVSLKPFRLELCQNLLFKEHVRVPHNQTSRRTHRLVKGLEPLVLSNLGWSEASLGVLHKDFANQVLCLLADE